MNVFIKECSWVCFALLYKQVLWRLRLIDIHRARTVVAGPTRFKGLSCLTRAAGACRFCTARPVRFKLCSPDKYSSYAFSLDRNCCTCAKIVWRWCICQIQIVGSKAVFTAKGVKTVKSCVKLANSFLILVHFRLLN